MDDSSRRLTAGEQAVLARLRRVCKALDGISEERDKFGHVAIKVGKQTLAMLGVKPDGVPSLGLKSDLTTQAFLVEGGRFYRTPYVGQHGWVSIDGTVRQMDWPAITDVITATYRAVAPKRRGRE
jgi:hypothetical protein